MKANIDISKIKRVEDTTDKDEATWMIEHGWILLDAGIGLGRGAETPSSLYVLAWLGDGPPPLP